MTGSQGRHTGVRSEESDVDTAFGAALVLILLSVFVTISVGTSARAEGATAISWIAGLLQAAAVGATIWVSGLRAATRNAALGVVVVATALAAVSSSVGGRTGVLVALSLWLAITASLPVLVARRLRVFERITLQTVLGYLVIYAIAGVLFGYCYRLGELVGPPAFDPGPQGVSGCLYYSYVTLTTLGYGDISPVSGFTRALAVTEAVLGQLYLVSVVGLVVGNLGRERHLPSLSGGTTERPSDEPSDR